MKIKNILSLVFVCSIFVPAIIADVDTVSGWGQCNTGGGYGGWNKESPCYTVWDAPCTENNRQATFVVGESGKLTTEITIRHLDGIAETMDGFEVRDEEGALVCKYIDAAPGPETWMTLVCDDLGLYGEHVLTIEATAEAPWSGCNTYGQVAISDITYSISDTNGQIPEFTVLGSLAVLGAAGVFIAKRKKQQN